MAGSNYPLGYQALTEMLGLKVIPYYRHSYLAMSGRGKTTINNHQEIHYYPKTYALKDPNNVFEQLEFALKYDGISLQIIKVVLETLTQNEMVKYVVEKPTGKYRRIVWFLYEYLLQVELPLDGTATSNYVNVLDPKKYYTAESIKCQRYRVNNNLLGNAYFCPVVRRTQRLEEFNAKQLDEKARALIAEYDPYIISRASNYLYTKETMSSYEIEREQPDKKRLTRFVDILKRATGIEKLTKDKLLELQNIIVDPRFKDFDYRGTQNYVAESLSLYIDKIHYISPKPEDVAELMGGLLEALDRMLQSDINPVIVAAAISFGFVFIHPYEDGNGRIHRFLIHYILAVKKFTPKDIIFPISAVMLNALQEYDQVLESFSKPLLELIPEYHLSNEGLLTVSQDTKLYYQYIDYSLMAEYLFSCIEQTLEKDFKTELNFIVNYDKCKTAIKSIVDVPDKLIDMFIKFVMQNDGKLSAQKRKKFFSKLTIQEIQEITEVINNIMLS